MKHPLFGRGLAALILLCAAVTGTASPPIQEMASPGLPDIASVHFPPGAAPVILYNPHLCRQAGPALCEFYRYHEYGHIVLRHNERNDLTLQEKEREADHWAALNAPLHSVIAAYRFFAAGHGGTPAHGAGRDRAERMIARSDLATRL